MVYLKAATKRCKSFVARHKILILICLIIGYILSVSTSPAPVMKKTEITNRNELKKFLDKFTKVLESATVKNAEKFTFGAHASLEYEGIYTDISRFALEELVQFEQNIKDEMRQHHRNVVSQIPENPKISCYEKRGYVTIGGGENDFLALLLIKQLRKIGADRLVEVVIPPLFKRNKALCDGVFPDLGAKCVMMEDVMGSKSLKRLKYNTKLISTLAVLTSSFDDVLYLSPSTMPLHNPDLLFDSKVYAKFGMIVWPSYYRSTITPSYYEIAGIKVEDTPVRILNDKWTPMEHYSSYRNTQKSNVKLTKPNFHDLKGTSSDYAVVDSVFMIKKSRHFDVLLLMLHYTNDGPSRYFPLLNPVYFKTNGDYITAAVHYLKKVVYQNMKTADKIGQQIGFGSAATAHYNPVEDYDLTVGEIWWQKNSRAAQKDKYKYDYYVHMKRPFNVLNSTPLFFHIEDPGLVPEKMKSTGLVYDELHSFRRLYGEHTQFYGTDFELEITELLNEILCKSKHKKIASDILQQGEAICKDFLPEREKYLLSNAQEFWAKFKFQKKPPRSVPPDQLTEMERTLAQGIYDSMNYEKDDVKRVN